MLISYGGYILSFTIKGGDAAFLTPAEGLADGRSGSVVAIRWRSGAQTAGTYVDILVTATDPAGGTPMIGAVGLINATGMPAGLRCVLDGTQQRLVAGARGELSAWALPHISHGTFIVRLYNDVAGAPVLAANAVFGLGQIFAGRCISLCTLMGSPVADIDDATRYRRTNGGQVWPLMRKPFRQYEAQLGLFSTQQIKGGNASGIVNGAGGAIDVQTLRDKLAVTGLCAVCDTPNAGLGAGAVVNDLRYDQSFMQGSWMMARMSNAGTIQQDKEPYWTWKPTFEEAS